MTFEISEKGSRDWLNRGSLDPENSGHARETSHISVDATDLVAARSLLVKAGFRQFGYPQGPQLTEEASTEKPFAFTHLFVYQSDPSGDWFYHSFELTASSDEEAKTMALNHLEEIDRKQQEEIKEGTRKSGDKTYYVPISLRRLVGVQTIKRSLTVQVKCEWR